MKRSGFKQPTYEQKLAKLASKPPRKPLSPFHTKKATLGRIKRYRGIKKPKKPTISTLKKKLWHVFSLYIRNRDKWTCFTCGRKAEGSGLHAGHFVPKSVGGLALYFHEKNVNAQCYNCNINLSGNIWEYGQRLGPETVAEIYELKKQITKWSTQDYLDKIKYYEIRVSEMLS